MTAVLLVKHPMEDNIVSLIQTAVTAWSRQHFATNEVLLGQIALDDDEERYLVDVAARPVGFWLVVEVWLEDGRVEAINDLGEGVPFTDAGWPWPEESRDGR